MLEFSNNGRWVQTADELPPVPSCIHELYLDFETSSNDRTKKSLNPWDVAHCTVIGAAVTWDDHPIAYFVPRHLLLTGWLLDIMQVSESWCNHNVKYDVHVASNDLGIEWSGPLIDTLALAKVYDADRYYKGGYALDVLSKQLLGRDIDRYHRAMLPYLPKKPESKRNYDYGRIPLDLLSEYACEDAQTVRLLRRWLSQNTPEDCQWVIDNEIRLTSSLVDMERRGLRNDPLQVKVQKARDMIIMDRVYTELKAELGYHVNPMSRDDCHDLLINRFGFPVVYNDKQKKRAEQGLMPNPSFDKNILKQYSRMGHQYAKFSDVVKKILAYRTSSQLVSLFWDPWLLLSDDDGIFHSSYNANVRSGRLSCSLPNAQQLSPIAKRHILARPGRKLLCWDYSQLEYRWMIHYLQNKAGMKAFNDDPWVDYHQWVADTLCGGIPRKQAKTMNFRIGFGGGKKGVVAALSIEPTIIEKTGGDPVLVKLEGERVFNLYHRNLPELKQHSRMAEAAAKQLGYVRTLYGRRLHLPERFARKGFNRVVQSTAADNAKEAANDASPTHNATLRDLDVYLVAQVHDEFVYDVPDDPRIIELASAEITRCLEAPSKRCRVPIKASRGPAGADNWYEAKGD